MWVLPWAYTLLLKFLGIHRHFSMPCFFEKAPLLFPPGFWHLIHMPHLQSCPRKLWVVPLPYSVFHNAYSSIVLCLLQVKCLASVLQVVPRRVRTNKQLFMNKICSTVPGARDKGPVVNMATLLESAAEPGRQLGKDKEKHHRSFLPLLICIFLDSTFGCCKPWIIFQSSDKFGFDSFFLIF